MNNVLALINLYPAHNLGYLTEDRPMASTTILARYAFIDFTLSNLTNSNIDNIGIMVKKNANSIYKHLGSSRTYLSNSKTGKMSLLINEKGLNNPVFNTDLNNLRENDFILYDDSKEYVIITNSHFLMKLDYAKVVDEHIKSGHQVSLTYTHLQNSTGFENAKKVVKDSLGNVQKIYKDDSKEESDVLLDTMVIDRKLFLDLIKKSSTLGDFATMNDFELYLLKYVHDGINLIEFTGYVALMDSFEKYYNVSMEILNNLDLLKMLFNDPNWIYYTTTHNMSPVKYGDKAKVVNSLIGNGSNINGTVKNSILARDVIVEEGAVVENSIIFSHCRISKGTTVRNVVADKRVNFEHQKVFESKEESKPIYLPRGANA